MSHHFTVATANLLNLALPNRSYYDNQDPYTAAEFERKIDWLGSFLGVLDADLIAVQEVWDEDALTTLAKRTGKTYHYVRALGAENVQPNAFDTTTDTHHFQNNTSIINGAQNTPAMGFMTSLKVIDNKRFKHVPDTCVVDIPELGRYEVFERPPNLLTLQLPSHYNNHNSSRDNNHNDNHNDRGDASGKLHVLNVHLKSKRPKFLRDASGNPLEDIDDPKVRVRAKLRSLCMRAAEAAAIRHIIIDLTAKTQVPLILMGDVNDATSSVTTQLMAETAEVTYDKSARDIALFNAHEYQTKRRMGVDVAYSHIYQGYPEVLDQIFVSEEFLPNSKYSLGEVLQVDYFNDHLKLHHSQRHSDHGFVRAVIRLDD